MGKENEFRQGYKKTEAGWIPYDWGLTTIDDIAEINPNNHQPFPDSTNVSFIPMADISEDGKIERLQTRRFMDVCKGYTYFADGDVLVAKITPCFENGKGALVHGLTNGVGFGSTEFHVLRSRGIDPGYLFLHTQSHRFRANGKLNMTGSVGQKRVPKYFIANFCIGLPRLPEQVKIVEVLKIWDRAIERVQRLIEAKQRQKKGLMQGLLTGRLRFPEFGEPVKSENDIPIGWKNNRLRELVTFHNGFGFPEQDQGNSVGDIPFIKVSDMLNTGNHKFIFASNNYVSSETMKLKGWKTAPASAIIFAKVGEALYKNRRRILAQDTIIDNNVMAIKAIPQKIDDYYLYYVMLLVNFSKIAFPGALPSVNQTELGNVHVILPGLSEQRKIIAILDRTDAEIDLINKKLALLQQQKKGLMQKLLTGEIRVKVD